jgi:hypothetical protein
MAHDTVYIENGLGALCNKFSIFRPFGAISKTFQWILNVELACAFALSL